MHFKESKNKKKMFVTLASIAAVMIFVFAGLKIYYNKGLEKYNNKFLANTFINDIDVSEKTPEEVYNIISQEADLPQNINIKKPDGNILTIPFSEIGYNDDLKAKIKEYYSSQDHDKWYVNLKEKTEYNLQSSFTYDEKLLKEQLNSKITDAKDSKDPQNAKIVRNNNVFTIQKEVQGTKYDSEKLEKIFENICDMVSEGEYTIDLSNSDCYLKPEIVADDLSEQVEELNKVFDTIITLDFDYATETLTSDTYKDWIIFDDDLSKPYTIDSEAAMTYVENIALKYDTYGTDRNFNSTSRGPITVSAGEGCYGWWIDQQQTCDMIIDLLKKGETTTTQPVYYTNPYSGFTYVGDPSCRTEESDIGNTYCEVDLKEQHFWYYKNGNLMHECDIVSGKPVQYRYTPEGVYKLWIKEKDRILKDSSPTGDSWNTQVAFWNNISTIGIGFHDATWQEKFGGDWYKEHGSHGCINMSYSDAEYVYENIDIGTPVVIYN